MSPTLEMFIQETDQDVWLHFAGLSVLEPQQNVLRTSPNVSPFPVQGNAPGEAEHYMGLAKETIEQLKSFAMDLRQQGQPIDNVVMT